MVWLSLLGREAWRVEQRSAGVSENLSGVKTERRMGDAFQVVVRDAAGKAALTLSSTQEWVAAEKKYRYGVKVIPAGGGFILDTEAARELEYALDELTEAVEMREDTQADAEQRVKMARELREARAELAKLKAEKPKQDPFGSFFLTTLA